MRTAVVTLPQSSVATKVYVRVRSQPSPLSTNVVITITASSQLSDAVTASSSPVGNSSHTTVPLAGRLSNVGASVSPVTETTCDKLVEFPQSSVAVQVRVIWY